MCWLLATRSKSARKQCQSLSKIIVFRTEVRAPVRAQGCLVLVRTSLMPDFGAGCLRISEKRIKQSGARCVATRMSRWHDNRQNLESDAYQHLRTQSERLMKRPRFRARRVASQGKSGPKRRRESTTASRCCNDWQLLQSDHRRVFPCLRGDTPRIHPLYLGGRRY